MKCSGLASILMVVSCYSQKKALLFVQFHKIGCSGKSLFERMTEDPISRMDRWKFRLKRIRRVGRRMFPFVSSTLAAVIIILLYNLTVPKTPPITQRDVDNSITAADHLMALVARLLPNPEV